MRVISVGAHAGTHQPTYRVDDLTQVTVSPTDDGFTLTID